MYKQNSTDNRLSVLFFISQSLIYLFFLLQQVYADVCS